MATMANGQPLSGVGPLVVSYTDSLRQQKSYVKPVLMKPISYLHGEPHEVVFSLAAVVGKPLKVDMATRNQTRPSCARVKMEGHNAEQCYVEHLELYPNERKGREEEKKKDWVEGKNDDKENATSDFFSPTEKKEEEFEMKDTEEEEEQQKENLKAVEDEKTEMPGIQGSDNKERRKKTQATVKGTSVLEVNNSSKVENTTLLEGRGSGHKDGT
ncbi:hypothetical protein H5410_014586 [Solanum commersonii]|uniref:Uncharacterized protein n=1 Tax=Solanum commersonii TaxID=4109 RepID=A0A9J5ZRT4_SOLCO|nr:hypothetical protein H5410_014586 [Solanum commersonii]